MRSVGFMFASLAENPCRTGVVANVSGSDSLARGVTAPETIVYGSSGLEA